MCLRPPPPPPIARHSSSTRVPAAFALTVDWCYVLLVRVSSNFNCGMWCWCVGSRLMFFCNVFAPAATAAATAATSCTSYACFAHAAATCINVVSWLFVDLYPTQCCTHASQILPNYFRLWNDMFDKIVAEKGYTWSCREVISITVRWCNNWRSTKSSLEFF